MEDISLSVPFTPYAPGDPALAGLAANSAGANLALGKFYTAFEDRISLVEDYSDLKYEQLDITVGGTYNFTEQLYSTAMATYSDFNSEEEYVYGDEDGTAYYGYVGVGYRF